ncbi:hypothetical protein IU450_28635 [Nocardia abscessus]|uniref:hypothetical protein n=1 Tax=Nocardia abscessus TaxID=120957 RepID=UPI00189592E2|nr:hypothetical protein [Nocardia abscessus]MBF6339828.1 hypothetical protein [Nocardia abscessus]
MKFSQLVQTALSEVKNIRRRLNGDHAEREQHLRAGLCALAHAIDRHQQALADTFTIPEHHDRKLWRVLDQITVPMRPNGRPTTARTMLDIYWT